MHFGYPHRKFPPKKAAPGLATVWIALGGHRIDIEPRIHVALGGGERLQVGLGPIISWRRREPDSLARKDLAWLPQGLALAPPSTKRFVQLTRIWRVY